MRRWRIAAVTAGLIMVALAGGITAVLAASQAETVATQTFVVTYTIPTVYETVTVTVTETTPTEPPTTTTAPPPPPPPPPSDEPGPIAGLGYDKVFGDEFDGPLNPAVWSTKEFWESPIPGSVYTSNGILNVRNIPSWGNTDVSATTGPYWFGDPVKKSWMFGYFEARMRFTDARGSWPAFWLLPVAHATWENWPDCPEPDLAFELDIMEYQGDEPFTYYAGQHRNTNGICGVPDQTRGPNTQPGGRLAGSTWRTYSVKWTAADLTFYVDGVQQGGVYPLFDSGDQLMFMALSMQVCGWDSSNSCPSQSFEYRTEVDWVRVWQR